MKGQKIADKALERLDGKEILYSSEDCQKFVEITHRLAGLQMKDYAGSNDMFRNACTAVYLIGQPPVGCLVFIVKHDGGEPAKYQDSLGNASHVGIYVGGGEVVDSSASAGKVHKSKLSSYTHYGLTKGVDFAGGINAPTDQLVDVNKMAIVLQPVRLRKSTDTSSSSNVIKQLGIGDQLEVLGTTTKGAELWARLEQTVNGLTFRGWACVEDGKTRYISLPGAETAFPDDLEQGVTESIPTDTTALKRELEAILDRATKIVKLLN